jgi:hypothetical protein
MRARLVFFAALAALSSFTQGDAAAQTTPAPNYVFDTIDSYRIYDAGYAGVTGVLHGQTAATTVAVVTNQDGACERVFIQSINRPGRFTVDIFTAGSSPASCQLVRNP